MRNLLKERVNSNWIGRRRRGKAVAIDMIFIDYIQHCSLESSFVELHEYMSTILRFRNIRHILFEFCPQNLLFLLVHLLQQTLDHIVAKLVLR